MPNIHLRNHYQKAVVCMVLAYISIALMGVFVKYASDELPSSEILFSRFFIGFVFLLPFLDFQALQSHKLFFLHEPMILQKTLYTSNKFQLFQKLC